MDTKMTDKKMTDNELEQQLLKQISLFDPGIAKKLEECMLYAEANTYDPYTSLDGYVSSNAGFFEKELLLYDVMEYTLGKDLSSKIGLDKLCGDLAVYAECGTGTYHGNASLCVYHKENSRGIASLDEKERLSHVLEITGILENITQKVIPEIKQMKIQESKETGPEGLKALYDPQALFDKAMTSLVAEEKKALSLLQASNGNIPVLGGLKLKLSEHLADAYEEANKKRQEFYGDQLCEEELRAEGLVNMVVCAEKQNPGSQISMKDGILSIEGDIDLTKEYKNNSVYWELPDMDTSGSLSIHIEGLEKLPYHLHVEKDLDVTNDLLQGVSENLSTGGELIFPDHTRTTIDAYKKDIDAYQKAMRPQIIYDHAMEAARQHGYGSPSLKMIQDVIEQVEMEHGRHLPGEAKKEPQSQILWDDGFLIYSL